MQSITQTAAVRVSEAAPQKYAAAENGAVDSEVFYH